jgi:hypothetical protein
VSVEVLGGGRRGERPRRGDLRRPRVDRAVSVLVTRRHPQVPRHLHRYHPPDPAVLRLGVAHCRRRLLPLEGRLHLGPLRHFGRLLPVVHASRRPPVPLELQLRVRPHGAAPVAAAPRDGLPQPRRRRRLRLGFRLRQDGLQDGLGERGVLLQLGAVVAHVQLPLHLLQVVEVLEVAHAAVQPRVLLAQLQHLLHELVQLLQVVEGIFGGDGGGERRCRPRVDGALLQRVEVGEEVVFLHGVGGRRRQFRFVVPPLRSLAR